MLFEDVSASPTLLSNKVMKGRKILSVDQAKKAIKESVVSFIRAYII